MSPTLNDRSTAALRFGGGHDHIEWARHFRLNDERISKGLGNRLHPRESDLLDVATAVYVTDRVTRRRPARRRGDEDLYWSRDLRIAVALRDPSFWNSADARTVVRDLLQWLSDDHWELTIEGEVRWLRAGELQAPLFGADVAPHTRIGLFSGGLDSVAGAALDLVASADPLILVSASTLDAMRVIQQRTLNELHRHHPGRVQSLIVPINLIGRPLRAMGLEKDAEPTQRTRALLFLALGMVAAINSGVDELRVYENGVGALNLPQSEAQFGSMTTRAMHPRTLALAARLATLIAERPIRVTNPSLASTKAQMCQALPAWAHPAVEASVSCDTALTHRQRDRRTTPWCGSCTSCILRRQSLIAGGLTAIDDTESSLYRTDVFEPRAPREKTLALRDMLGQASAIQRALAAHEPWTALARAFPAVLDAVAPLGPGAPDLLRRLLAQYVDEWHAIQAPIVHRYLAPNTSMVAA